MRRRQAREQPEVKKSPYQIACIYCQTRNISTNHFCRLCGRKTTNKAPEKLPCNCDHQQALAANPHWLIKFCPDCGANITPDHVTSDQWESII